MQHTHTHKEERVIEQLLPEEEENWGGLPLVWAYVVHRDLQLVPRPPLALLPKCLESERWKNGNKEGGETTPAELWNFSLR